MLYTVMNINQMPDISKGLPKDYILYNDIPEAFQDGTGSSMILLRVPYKYGEEDDDGVWLTSDIVPAYDLTIESLMNNNCELQYIDRNVMELYYDDITLYHGTTELNAEKLRKNGWEPYSGSRGNQYGNIAYLYLTNIYENALWFANEKNSHSVLSVKLPFKDLIVDPEDGSGDNIFQEYFSSLAFGLPAYLSATKPIDFSKIKECKKDKNSHNFYL